jgi:hypothetical protein
MRNVTSHQPGPYDASKTTSKHGFSVGSARQKPGTAEPTRRAPSDETGCRDFQVGPMRGHRKSVISQPQAVMQARLVEIASVGPPGAKTAQTRPIEPDESMHFSGGNSPRAPERRWAAGWG